MFSVFGNQMSKYKLRNLSPNWTFSLEQQCYSRLNVFCLVLSTCQAQRGRDMLGKG